MQVMSAKKHKRKHVKHITHARKDSVTASLISRYPRLFLGTGILLVLVAVLLITIGYVSDARIGLSMISLFFGVGLVIFANSALPKS
jgi:hypothetical protein